MSEVSFDLKAPFTVKGEYDETGTQTVHQVTFPPDDFWKARVAKEDFKQRRVGEEMIGAMSDIGSFDLKGLRGLCDPSPPNEATATAIVERLARWTETSTEKNGPEVTVTGQTFGNAEVSITFGIPTLVQLKRKKRALVSFQKPRTGESGIRWVESSLIELFGELHRSDTGYESGIPWSHKVTALLALFNWFERQQDEDPNS